MPASEVVLAPNTSNAPATSSTTFVTFFAIVVRPPVAPVPVRPPVLVFPPVKPPVAPVAPVPMTVPVLSCKLPNAPVAVLTVLDPILPIGAMSLPGLTRLIPLIARFMRSIAVLINPCNAPTTLAITFKTMLASFPMTSKAAPITFPMIGAAAFTTLKNFSNSSLFSTMVSLMLSKAFLNPLKIG